MAGQDCEFHQIQFLQIACVLISTALQACTIDVLMHLPQSVFSTNQLDILIWLLKVNGIPDVPSIRGIKKLNDLLQTMHGVETLSYEGALGHKYYVNSLSGIIAQVNSFFY